MLIRSPYDGKRVVVQLVCNDGSRTKQAFKKSSDINNIVAQYRKTGQLPISNIRARYEDCTGVTDYYSALCAISNAEGAFNSLPAKVRKHFGNDPGQLIEAMDNPERRDELVELGLIAPEAPKEPRGDKPAEGSSKAAEPTGASENDRTDTVLEAHGLKK